MGRVGQKQVQLGSAQPSFPGGWVMALLDAVCFLAPDSEAVRKIPKHSRTATRMRAGDSIEEPSYKEWESRLVKLVQTGFPRAAAINDFAVKYVEEYFRLWKVSAEAAPIWAGFDGVKPESLEILSRALVRDLVLRLCFLECWERHLAGRTEATLLQSASFEDFYAQLIAQAQRAAGKTQEALARSFRVDPVMFRRWKSGERVPRAERLRQLLPNGDERLIAGVLLGDLLLRRLGLRGTPVASECLQVAEVFLREQPSWMATFRGVVPSAGPGEADRQVAFAEFAHFSDNLLLHPGWEHVRASMPDGLWRAHVVALRFGQFFDLAQHYLKFASDGDERTLRVTSESLLREW